MEQHPSSIMYEGKFDPSLILSTMVKCLPSHIQNEWYSDHKPLKLSFLTKSPEELFHEKSAITPEELSRVHRLKEWEQQFSAALKGKSYEEKQALLSFSYQELKAHPETSERHLQTLALSITAMKTTYEPKDPSHLKSGEIKDISITQRIALLRCVDALENHDSKGLIEVLRSGLGKTAILIPTILPNALLTKNHWDVTSLTPTSRDVLFKRFAPVALLFNIRVSKLTPNEALTMITDASDMSKTHAWMAVGDTDQSRILTEDGVTFANTSDICHHLERFPETIVQTRKENTGVVIDEIDHTSIDETSTPFIIAGTGEPVAKVIKRYWKPFFDELTHLPAEEKDVREQLMTYVTKHRKELLKDTNAENLDTNAKNAVSLLKMFFSEIDHLPEQNSLTPVKDRVRTPNGALENVGAYDVVRRMYCTITGNTYNEDEFIPDAWDSYLKSVFPPHILKSINGALSGEHSYFVDKISNAIILTDPHTGYPLRGNEYEPLVMLMLNVRESLKTPDLSLPKTLHEMTDSLSNPEYMGIRYSKILGFTGTGEDLASHFRDIYGVETVAIPPQYQERLEVKPLEIASSFAEKLRAISTLVHAHTEKSDTPILIDVTTEEELLSISADLHDVSEGWNIRTLSCVNADEANTAFTDAGKPKTITIVRLMAGREVDIPVNDDLVSSEGLMVLSVSPRDLMRNTRQLQLRTARNDQNGVFIQFVSPEDPVFRVLEPNDQKKLQLAFEKHATGAVEKLIEKAQWYHEQDVLKNIHIMKSRYDVLTMVRRSFAQLPEIQKEKIRSVWRDFLMIYDTITPLIVSSSDGSNLSPEQRLKVWDGKIADTFQKLVGASTSKKFDLKAWRILEELQDPRGSVML